MTTYEAFAAAEPKMAKVLRSSLDWIPICYIASVRRNGAPRVHPFCPIFAEERMFIAVPPWSAKRFDLARDGRFAMHALPGKRDDEFYLTGRAELVENDELRASVVVGAKHTVHPDDDVFELCPEYVMTAYWEMQGKPDTYAVRQEWRATQGAASDAPTPARAASGSRGTRTRSPSPGPRPRAAAAADA